MQAIGSALNSRFRRWRVIWLGGLVAIAGCLPSQTATPPKVVDLYQGWELQPGAEVSGYRIAGGLGDISVQLDGKSAYAPFAGRVESLEGSEDCVIFSSDEVPAYLLRFCGLSGVRFGAVTQGQAMGRGQQLQFAVLRQQPDGTWALVEPSSSLLERSLQPE